MAGEGGGTKFLPNVERGGGQAGVPEWIHQSPPAKEDMSSLGLGSQTRSLTQVHPEEQRLEALQTLKSLFKTPSKALQDLVDITKRTFKSDTVLLTMVDERHEWIIYGQNTNIVSVPREDSFGQAHYESIDPEEPSHLPMVLHEVKPTEPLCRNPFVREGARFYAGAPLFLRREAGREYFIGTLCILDYQARGSFSEQDASLLTTLATMTMREVESMPQREEGAMMPIEKEDGLAERVRELQSFQVFAMRAVDVGCVRMIAEKLTARIVPAGQYLCRKGDPGDSLFFVAGGSCSCKLKGQELERLNTGSCFGEVALLNICKAMQKGATKIEASASSRRIADVVTLERCELLELSCDVAFTMLRKAPNLWFTLEDMAKRRSQTVTRMNASPLHSPRQLED